MACPGKLFEVSLPGKSPARDGIPNKAGPETAHVIVHVTLWRDRRDIRVPKDW